MNNPEATAYTIDKDGWLHTGDVGFVDDDDEVFIVDRVKEIIKFKGFQVNFALMSHLCCGLNQLFYKFSFCLNISQVPPAELEAILLSHPSILDSACVP